MVFLWGILVFLRSVTAEMKIVVTGALGHIGSALIRYLPLEFPDCEIIMIDNLYTQRYCSLFHLPPGNYRFIEADVRGCNLPEHDVVVHLAAYTEPHINLDWKHNRDATFHVCRQAKRIIFPSTISVMPKPQTIYAETKLQEEKLVNIIDGSILRLGNLFGPSPGMRFHTVVSKLCWQAVNKQPLSVWKTALDQRRPYLDLIDVVRAICFFIRNDHRGTFNLVTQTATLGRVVELIKTYVPIDIELINVPHMNDIQQDVDAAEVQKLGFEFTGSLVKGISSTLNWLQHD